MYVNWDNSYVGIALVWEWKEHGMMNLRFVSKERVLQGDSRYSAG